MTRDNVGAHRDLGKMVDAGLGGRACDSQKGVRTYPLQQTLHLFKPILERLDVALWRTAFLCDLDIRAVELVRAAV